MQTEYNPHYVDYNNPLNTHKYHLNHHLEIIEKTMEPLPQSLVDVLKDIHKDVNKIEPILQNMQVINNYLSQMSDCAKSTQKDTAFEVKSSCQISKDVKRIKIILEKFARVVEHTPEISDVIRRRIAVDIQHAYRIVYAHTPPTADQEEEFTNFDFRMQWYIAKNTLTLSQIQHIVSNWDDWKRRGKLDTSLIHIRMFDQLQRAMKDNVYCLTKLKDLREKYIHLCLDSTYDCYTGKQTTADSMSNEVYDARFRCFIHMCQDYIQHSNEHQSIETWLQKKPSQAEKTTALQFITKLQTQTPDQLSYLHM